MSPRKKPAAPKSGTAEEAARANRAAVAGMAASAKTLARALFDLSEDAQWRSAMVKPLRLAFDLGSELQKAVELAERNVESAKWKDRQPNLDLDGDNDDE